MQLKHVRRAEVSVVSVGNLTTGGTGKTPVVALIVQILQRHDLRPAMISRGYGSIDGQANDEKRVLERLCPNVPHEQNPSRFVAASIVTKSKDIDAIVMDDGFQHRQLHRDLDVVLIDATNPFGYDHLLPRGLLREPLSSLGRADTVLITRADMVKAERLQEIEQQVRTAAPHLAERIYRVEFRATGMIDGKGQRFPLSEFAGRCVMLASGIGNPQAFADTCLRSGMMVAGTQWFPDHHHYSAEDVRKIAEKSRQLGAVGVVVTLKDLVKLPASANFLALEIAAVIPDKAQADAFARRIQDASATEK